MEDWQLGVINYNLPKLINVTLCSKTLIATLLAQNIISKEEKQKIIVLNNTIDQADKLYDLLLTRVNGYKVLLKACKEDKQSGVVSILEKGELEHNLSEALRECSVNEFICRCFISTSDFESIAQAIAKYSEITQFKEAFENNSKKKPWFFRGPKNETLLHVATAYGYIKLMKYFISKGVDVNDVDIDGRTAGHYLGKYSINVIETTKTLISNGLNIFHVDKKGMSVAHTLPIHNKINQFHYHIWADHIIKQGQKEVLAQKSKTGSTTLHHAMKTLDMGKPTFELLNTDGNINSCDIKGRTILHEALMSGRSLETIENLISLGADYKINDKNNTGVLHFAVEGGNTEVVKLMISLETNVNVMDAFGETPLHKVRFTIAREYLEITRILLDNGAHLSEKNRNENTVAHLMALTENISPRDFQIWATGIINIGYGHIFAIRGQYGRTPLQSAMKRLDLNMSTLKLVLKSSKVDIDQPDDNECTLLHIAVYFARSLETTKNFIELGANIKIKDRTGDGVLHNAVVGGNKEVIQYLISLGFDVNEKNNYGNTPLHFVQDTKSKNYVELTKLLLENNADLCSKNKDGDTLAHIMAVWKDVCIEDYKIWVTGMIENGHAYLFTTRGYLGRTPLHSLVISRVVDLETINLIIEYAKLDINQPDDQGNTILHLALIFGNSLDTIESLIKLGADWKRKGMDECSAMHSAVHGNNKKAFLFFKSVGADVNSTDKFGETPLHYVTYTRNKDYLGITKFLLENGAKLNAKNNFGRSLDYYMASEIYISAEEYAVWEEGMIKMGHAPFRAESAKTTM